MEANEPYSFFLHDSINFVINISSYDIIDDEMLNFKF